MATAIGEKERELMDLKKKNETLSSEVERLTNMLKQSERKRRKQKVVYEKNMENLSIRLADFEKNLRREQKELQDLISKKDKQIKVREDLTKTLRQKLSQQHCVRCGYPNPSEQSMELDWQLEIDEENDEVVKTLPPLDLPPPQESTNIGFTNHRPFRPKSKLSPVAEESEITFASSLRNIHADLTPDRFHAALTASLNLLNESDGAETPANSTTGGSSGKLSHEDSCVDLISSSEKISPPDSETPEVQGKVLEGRKKNDITLTTALSSFCDSLCSQTMKLVNENFSKPKVKVTKASTKQLPKTALFDFSLHIVQESLNRAFTELKKEFKSNYNEQKSACKYVQTNKRTVDNTFDHLERLHSAAEKVADNFLSNGMTSKMINQGIKEKHQLIARGEVADVLSEPDAPSSSIPDVILTNRISDEEISNKLAALNLDEKRKNILENKVPEIMSDEMPEHTSVIDRDQPVQCQTNVVPDEKSVTKPEQTPPQNGNFIVADTSNLPNGTDTTVFDALNESNMNQDSSSPSSKKKKKKKKKKRKSISLEENNDRLATTHTNTGIDGNSIESGHGENGFQLSKSPEEDKYSLMLEEQLDFLEDNNPKQQTENKLVLNGEEEITKM